MKKNQKGFVLAETLIVTVFLMVIFTMIYTNFYPLIGEYEKREEYDNIDGKYTAFWVKRMIEDSTYTLDTSEISSNGYVRFSCDNFTTDLKKTDCQEFVNALSIDGCDEEGANCSAFISAYKLGNSIEESSTPCFTGSNECFKAVVESDDNHTLFTTAFQDYVASLPDYLKASKQDANYRVTIITLHEKDEQKYYSYSNIEVKK